jgi:hypothetical protein
MSSRHWSIWVDTGNVEIRVEQAWGGKSRSAEICAVLPLRLTGLNAQKARTPFPLKSVLQEVNMLTLGGKACPLIPREGLCWYCGEQSPTALPCSCQTQHRSIDPLIRTDRDCHVLSFILMPNQGAHTWLCCITVGVKQICNGLISPCFFWSSHYTFLE